MSAATESRLDGFKKSAEHKPNRYQLILMCLSGTDGMTAEEIRDELYAHELIPFRDMNMVRPRLTELKKSKLICEKGRRDSKTGVKTTVWALT